LASGNFLSFALSHFNFWIFDTDESLRAGSVPLDYDPHERTRPPQEKAFPYKVDAKKREITIGEDGYKYEFINSKTVILKKLETSFEMYEVPSRPEIFFRSEHFLDFEKMFSQAQQNNGLLTDRLRMLNHYIEAAKDDAPPPPKPPVDPPPPPEPPVDPPPPPITNVTVVNQENNLFQEAQEDGDQTRPQRSEDTESEPFDGRYEGTLHDMINGVERKFTIQLTSSSRSGTEPSGRDEVTATVRFEGDDTEKRLEGSVSHRRTYRSISLRGDPEGDDITIRGRVIGHELIADWSSRGANGESILGSLEAARIGP
jgi:hypothetical protein